MSERGRKPIPKTQRELSQEQIQPYDDRGNPNVGEGIVEIKEVRPSSIEQIL